jgi:hypothetical protein
MANTVGNSRKKSPFSTRGKNLSWKVLQKKGQVVVFICIYAHAARTKCDTPNSKRLLQQLCFARAPKSQS